MNKSKKQTIYYLENINIFILGGFLFFLPLFFLSTTTDPFILPKQILLSAAVSLSALLFGVKTIIEGKIKFRATPFDLPVAILAACALASSIFAVNRADALTAFLPFLFVTLLYFVITNTVKQAQALLFIIATLVLGTCFSALIAIFSFLKIYPLPFPYTQATYFNTFGSLLDQAIYFALILPITGYFIYSIFATIRSKGKSTSVFQSDQKPTETNINPTTIAFSIAFFIILAGLCITAYQLITTQIPLILPLETGFQTAFASISQDTGRIFWGFLFGSGLGTYATDFTRYKSITYNLNQNLWSLPFFRSSTFILELLATTGILGLISFLFLIYKIIKERNFFLPIILAVILTLFLPFSFTLLILFYSLLGIFAVIRAHNNPEKFTEVELYFVTLKRGLLAAHAEGESVSQNTAQRKYSKLLPLFFFFITLLLVGFPLYFSIRLFLSDILYNNSLIAYSQHDGGIGAYNLQLSSIKIFPYRDLYYRGLSQTNIAIAKELVVQTGNSTPSAQTQQQILLRAQEAITAGRTATAIAPLTAFNWNNLSSIYRGLIGFGQNADKFAILTDQQAAALDPNNPQQYIDLGGIYYQLGLYDDAIRQFQIAINLKNDYSNAYYNLGHALEAKGDLQNGLAAYQAVKTLVANDKDNTKKITDEIRILQEKINQQNQHTFPTTATSSAALINDTAKNEPLKINQPNTQLPERKPKVNIPGPTISPLPTQIQVKSEPTETSKATPIP
jgi:tetratricopeptide (TPR) repeat protein